MSLVREIEFGEHTVKISQDFGGELGATVWDSALVLLHYFENEQVFGGNFFKNKRVIELGAGTGVVGICAAILGAQVTLTDREELLTRLIQKNAKENNVENLVTTHILEWGADVSPLNPPFDVILMSDVVAETYSKSYPQLLQTLKDLSNPNSFILLSYELRKFSDVKFFQMLNQSGFTYTKINNRELHSDWQADDIGIFKIQRLQ